MKNRYLAYFDILGYKERISTKSLDEEYRIYSKFVKDAKDCCTKFIKGKGSGKVDFLYFSDTILSFTPDDSEISFASIIGFSLCLLVTGAVRNTPYLPLRAAITFGEFSNVNNIFIGPALRQACELEKEQEWSGCCLSLECVKKTEKFKYFIDFVKTGLLVKYKVPMKNQKKYDTYVVNPEAFPRIFGEHTRDMPITDPKFLENIFKNIGELNNDVLELNGKSEKKLGNTQEFFQHIENIKTQFE
jgi:hypothetical protein